MPGHSPLNLPKSATKGIDLFHWSWMDALTIAMLLLYEDKFENPEQKYILAEMTRYFSHPSIGVSTFDSMNSEWKDVVNKIQSGVILNKTDLAIENTIGAWHQESRDISLLLSRKLNRLVSLKLNKQHLENPNDRVKLDCENLCKNSKLECILEIPDAASPMIVTADLLRRSISVSMKVAAPTNKQKTSSRVNWLLKQLSKSKPENTYIKAIWPGRHDDTQVLLSKVRENPTILQPENTAISPSEFEVKLILDLAGKFSGPKTFNEQLDLTALEFYENIGQHLRIFIPTPPAIKEEHNVAENNVVSLMAEKSENVSIQVTNEIQSTTQVFDSEEVDKINPSGNS